MGSSSLLDIIGSMIIAGFLFLMAMRMSEAATETSSAYHAQLDLQTNMTTLVSILEFDLRKIGYCKDFSKIPKPNESLIMVDSTRIRFKSDYNNDGDLDSIYYYVGAASELTDTPNPRDRYLYKQTNSGTPVRMNLGVTEFKFRYFDALGDLVTFPILDPREVYSMEISVKVEAADPYAQKYVTDIYAYETFWRQIRLVSRNLQNR